MGIIYAISDVNRLCYSKIFLWVGRGGMKGGSGMNSESCHSLFYFLLFQNNRKSRQHHHDKWRFPMRYHFLAQKWAPFLFVHAC
jgi:hypothetical protein